MMHDEVYILETYEFYCGNNIILISQNYTKVKELFEKLVKESKTENGYVIYRFKLDKEYLDWNERAESLDWIEIDYDGNKIDIKMS